MTVELSNLERMAGVGESTATVDVSPPPSGPLPPRASGDGGTTTLKEQALAGLPPEWRERLISNAGHAGVKHDQDVGWLLLGSVVDSAAAALAAGASVGELTRLLDTLPNRMLDGARLAGADVAGELKTATAAVAKVLLDTGRVCGKSVEAGGEKAKKTIEDATVLGADKIKTASESLIGKLDEAVEQKKAEGAQAWAMIAEKAAVDSAKTALGKLALRSRMFTVLLVLIGVGVGAAGLGGVRQISGDYLPAGVQTFSTPSGGYFIRFAPAVVTLKNGKQCGPDICVPVLPK